MKIPKKLKISKIMVFVLAILISFNPLYILAEEIEEASLDNAPPALEISNTGDEGSNEDGTTIIESGDIYNSLNVENDINQNATENEEVTEEDEQELIDDDTEGQVLNEEEDQGALEEDLSEESGEENSEELDEENSEEANILTENDLKNQEEGLQGEGEAELEEYFSEEEDESYDGSEGNSIENNNESEASNTLENSGVSGENSITEENDTALIKTGDIDLETSLENNINQNDLNEYCIECEDEEATTTEIEIKNNNTSKLENKTEVTATSGDNIIKESDKAYIDTGNISIVNILVNFINTNFVGIGKEYFVNIFNKMNGSLDLSGYGEDQKSLSNQYGLCDGIDCRVNIENTSTSSLNNVVDINAHSGLNTIATASKIGYIKTGDIEIANDIMNMANLNISGNEWFFAVVNIFGEMKGDIILPAFKNGTSTLGEISSEILGPDPEVSSEFVISSKNNSGLENNINTNASTGDNSILGENEDGSLILTGDIINDSKIVNFINYNITGDFWKFARINVFGSWQGIVNGLPPEYSYHEDENGIIIYNTFLEESYLNKDYAHLVVDNYNVASTTNEINIDAKTGENSILHGESRSIIETGYIKIKNSLLNFLNSNFSGNNWEFSLVNVFGEWKGNLDFGQPDLWVNMTASEKNTASKDDYVTYTFLYGNNGDSTARNVVIKDRFNKNILEIIESSGASTSDDALLWEIGDISPNSQGSFTYIARVKEVSPGSHYVENVSEIYSEQGDRNLENNISRSSYYVDGATISQGFSIASSFKSSFPSLSIVKTNDAEDIVYPGDIINYKLIIKNSGNRDALEVYVLDVMSEIDTGVEIYRDFWDLGTVYAGEEIIIDYSLEITSDIESGTYINEATIEGLDDNRGVYISAIGSSRNKIVNEEVSDNYLPNLTISRVSRSSFIVPGALADFEIIIANNGLADALNVELKELLPEGFTYLFNGLNHSSWIFDIIKSGEIKNIKYTLSVSDKAVAGFYDSYLSLNGENFSTLYLNSKMEIKIIEEEKNKEVEIIEEEDRDARRLAITDNRNINTSLEKKADDSTPAQEEEAEENKEDDEGEVLGVEEAMGTASMFKYYLFIVFAIFFFLFLFWIVNENDKEKKA